MTKNKHRVGQGTVLRPNRIRHRTVPCLRNALESDNNPFRYCGEYFDTATETYFLRARWYDPATGRFTQQDSWAYFGEKNFIMGGK